MLASGQPELFDLGVHRLELAHRATEQDHFGTGGGQRQRDGAANARSRAGDHDDPAA